MLLPLNIHSALWLSPARLSHRSGHSKFQKAASRCTELADCTKPESSHITPSQQCQHDCKAEFDGALPDKLLRSRANTHASQAPQSK